MRTKRNILHHKKNITIKTRVGGGNLFIPKELESFVDNNERLTIYDVKDTKIIPQQIVLLIDKSGMKLEGGIDGYGNKITKKEIKTTDDWDDARQILFGFGMSDEAFRIPTFPNGTLKFTVYPQLQKMAVQINNGNPLYSSKTIYINTKTDLAKLKSTISKVSKSKLYKAFGL
jgi:hypothetical protein